MSPVKPEMPLEEVLLAFAVEPVHDRGTLERYLELYPRFAEELVDLSHELRIGGRSLSEAVDEATVQRALQQLVGASARAQATAANPFDTVRGEAFADLADTLRVPRSLLMAFRDRLVIASTVPAAFAARVARGARTTLADLMKHLELPSQLAPQASYKADGKPSAAEKVAFDALLKSNGVTEEQKTDIYTAVE
jgi:hypothetical protein